MADRDFKDLPRGTASDIVLREKTFNFAKNPKYDKYQIGLASMVYKSFDEKSLSGAVPRAQSKTLAIRDKQDESTIENKIMSNQQLAEKLHKLVVRTFEKQRGHSFNDNIVIIDIYSKYTRVVPLKNEKGITVKNAFQKILHKSGRKPYKM